MKNPIKTTTIIGVDKTKKYIHMGFLKDLHWSMKTPVDEDTMSLREIVKHGQSSDISRINQLKASAKRYTKLAKEELTEEGREFYLGMAKDNIDLAIKYEEGMYEISELDRKLSKQVPDN